MRGRLPTCYSPVRHSIHSPKRALIVRLACVKHAASVHPEPGSNSPWKMSQSKLCVLQKNRTWKIRSDPPSPVRKPMWFESLRSHRIGLLTGPLDTTGSCGLLYRPYWLHHSIQFSRFRRSEGIRYVSSISLSTTFPDLFQRSARSRPVNVLGNENAPGSASRRRQAGSRPPSLDGPLPYPIDPTEFNSFKTALRSSKPSGASLNTLPLAPWVRKHISTPFR